MSMIKTNFLDCAGNGIVIKSPIKIFQNMTNLTQNIFSVPDLLLIFNLNAEIYLENCVLR